MHTLGHSWENPGEITSNKYQERLKCPKWHGVTAWALV